MNLASPGTVKLALDLGGEFSKPAISPYNLGSRLLFRWAATLGERHGWQRGRLEVVLCDSQAVCSAVIGGSVVVASFRRFGCFSCAGIVVVVVHFARRTEEPIEGGHGWWRERLASGRVLEVGGALERRAKGAVASY